MTKIDIYSGFLGAGKTTLIKKLIAEGYQGQKLVLIENEFGEIGIDGGFLQEAGIQITEMNSGCICCSLVGDFGKALAQVITEYHPDRVLIEPSGVGKLSDVIAAVKRVELEDVELGYTVAVVNAAKCKVFMKNFGEFFNNQVETASTIVLSRTDSIAQDKLDAAVALLREHNNVATMVTTPWDQLTGAQLIEAMEHKQTLADELAKLEIERLEAEEQEHHHHHDEEEEHHCCHHHDEEHHHHEDEEHHCCHHHDEEHHHHEEHEHHHQGGECCCGHDHEHHHHHHADEVFASWGVETAKKFSQSDLAHILEELDSGEYGTILRAKGIVAGTDGNWFHFDYVPGETNIRTGSAAVTGRLCVIGAQLKEADVAKLFGV